MGNGSAIQETGFLYDFEIALGRWHRSKDKKATPYSEFASYMMNKKWWLEEQFNVHMMRFQQVMNICLSNNLKPVVIQGWIDDE